jgi:hypothetical protein
MKGWTRFFCVLIALYNLIQGWATEIRLGLGVCNNLPDMYPSLKTAGILVMAALFMFLLAHCVRLVMLFESSRKIQLFLSGSMPFVRVPSVLLLLQHQNRGMSPLLLVAMVIGVVIDLLTLIPLVLPAVRRDFASAEKARQDKWTARRAASDVG